MMQQIKQRSLLVKCLTTSLILHIGGLFFFYKNPLLLSPSFNSFLGRLLSAPGAVLKDHEAYVRNQQLEDAFQEIVMMPPQKETPFDLTYNLNDSLAAPLLQPSEKTLPAPFSEEILSENEQTFLATLPPQDNPADLIAPLMMEEPAITPSVRLETLTPPKSENLIEELPLAKQPVHEEKDDFALSDFAPPKKAESKELPQNDAELSLPFENRFPSSGLAAEEGDERVPLVVPKSSTSSRENNKSRQIAKSKSVPEIATYSLPQSTQPFAWRDDFDVNVHLMPEKEGSGYVFTLVLTPRPDTNAERITQNFYFLIDRSHSVDKNRFTTFKKGVLKALPFIQEGDTFNICIFDNKVALLSEKNLPMTPKSLQMAADFLEKEAHGGRFASGDLYTYLDKIVPTSVTPDHINTAILLSNGKTSLTPKKQQKAIQNWINKNEGKVALYSAAIGQDNNLVLLDLLSTCNGGELLYSDTHSGFSRKLAKLILTLKDPIAKEITLFGLPADPDAKITFYPVSSYLPALYQSKPYVIQGTIDQITDFTLLFEAVNGEQKLQIAKKISFEKATKASAVLAKKWENRRASLCYEQFLDTGKEEELLKAKELLKATCGEIAFE
jgi:hypothetical protein